MRIRLRKYENISPVDFLLLRDKSGLRRYRKTAKRDPEERKVLLNLALKKMEEEDLRNFTLLRYKRRRVKI
jgi:hypothetical protein